MNTNLKILDKFGRENNVFQLISGLAEKAHTIFTTKTTKEEDLVELVMREKLETLDGVSNEVVYDNEDKELIPISKLELSSQVVKILEENNISILYNLIQLEREELEEKVGKKNTEEIESKLLEEGYKLKSKED